MNRIVATCCFAALGLIGCTDDTATGPGGFGDGLLPDKTRAEPINARAPQNTMDIPVVEAAEIVKLQPAVPPPGVCDDCRLTATDLAGGMTEVQIKDANEVICTVGLRDTFVVFDQCGWTRL